MTAARYPQAKWDGLPGAGGFLGGPPRGVLHTTEGSSYAGARGAYLANRVSPHFTIGVEGCWQHVDVNLASTALENLTGGVETNRLSAIQIEVVGFAARPDWPADLISKVTDLMTWLEGETGIKPHAPELWGAGDAYGLRTPYRMTPTAWSVFDGWCGHQHVPENQHWDPGRIPIDKLLVRTAAAPPPLPATKEVTGVKIIVGSIGPVTLDGNGHGWVPVPAPLDRVMFVETRGSAPARDGGYWQVVNQDVNDSGDQTIVTLYGAPQEVVVIYYKILAEQ